MRVLALCGSRRTASVNAALLRAAAQLAPAGMTIEACQDLGTLPLFNADLEPTPPEDVLAFQDQVAQADALLIASPEYAHGVSGTIKNALDWLVGFEPFAGKSVAVLNASPRAQHADAALRETLATMAACIIEPASISVPVLGHALDEQDILASAESAAAIRAALLSLRSAIDQRPGAAAPASPWWA